jgi:hypothetical protein
MHRPACTLRRPNDESPTRVRTRAHGRRALALLGLAGMLLGALGGCQSPAGGAAATREDTSVLEIFAPPSPAEAAAMAADAYDADDRQRGILLLSNAPWGGAEAYVELYRLGLRDELAADDPDDNVRIASIRALSRLGEASDAARIAPMLDDDNWLVRWEAARALQRLHDPAVVGDVVSRVDADVEPEPEVRAAAAEALGQYAEARVLDALLLALDDRDLIVNAAARRSLRTLTGQRLGFEPAAWFAWLDETDDPFAQRREYRFPVFERDQRWYEWVNPFATVPNEEPERPVGMAPIAASSTGEG